MKIERNLPDLAVNADEAAAVMGVHFTQPVKMGRLEKIRAKEFPTFWKAQPVHGPSVFSLRDCEKSFLEYMERLREGGGKVQRQPRKSLENRTIVFDYLEGQPKILFSDAIGTSEAAEILQCHATYALKLCQTNRVLTRKGWSRKVNAASPTRKRNYIISRKSVVKYLHEMKQLEASGSKRGVLKYST
jgi:hypothetical protein